MSNRKCYGRCGQFQFLEGGTINRDHRACGRDIKDIGDDGAFISPGKCLVESPLYRPYHKSILTDSGIIETDGPDNKCIRLIPNDDRVVQLLRKAIALWENGDYDNLTALYDNWNKREKAGEFTKEEGMIFGCTEFPYNEYRSVDLAAIMEHINLESKIEVKPGWYPSNHPKIKAAREAACARGRAEVQRRKALKEQAESTSKNGDDIMYTKL